MKILGLGIAMLLATGLLACKTISPEAKAAITGEVDCSTAEQDLAVLEAERASVGKRIVSGVRSVMPVSAVVGILSGDYINRVSVATGVYNRDIEQKEQQISEQCGIPLPGS